MDGTLLFSIMDRDLSGYLDNKELRRARAFMLTSFSGSMDSHAMDGLLNHVDDNNDGKVTKVEWHDFLRSIYEVLGKKRFMDGVRSWKIALYDEADREAAEKKEQEEEEKERKKRKPVNRSKTAPATSREAAATKIQARVRGNQARERVRKKKAAGKVSHDADAVASAKQAGRHLITVISQDESHGNRADFYLDGEEIQFTASDGDIGRGMQVVTVDPDSCKVVSKQCYDTKARPSAESQRLAKDLGAVSEGVYVLIAVKGSGLCGLSEDAIAAMQTIGSCYPELGTREEGYALIGCKGYAASAERHAGKAEAEAMVSFERTTKGERLRRTASG